MGSGKRKTKRREEATGEEKLLYAQFSVLNSVELTEILVDGEP
jgi:hypothetical protein